MQAVLQRESAHLHYLLHHLQIQQDRLHRCLRHTRDQFGNWTIQLLQLSCSILTVYPFELQASTFPIIQCCVHKTGAHVQQYKVVFKVAEDISFGRNLRYTATL